MKNSYTWHLIPRSCPPAEKESWGRRNSSLRIPTRKSSINYSICFPENFSITLCGDLPVSNIIRRILVRTKLVKILWNYLGRGNWFPLVLEDSAARDSSGWFSDNWTVSPTWSSLEDHGLLTDFYSCFGLILVFCLRKSLLNYVAKT